MASDKRSRQIVFGLIATLAGDAVFDAVALYPLAESTWWGRWAKQWAKDDLDRLRFPQEFRFVFPVVKTGAVIGLLLGLRWRGLGRLTAAAVVAYFVVALAFHVRVRDPARWYVPALVMLAWSCATLRALGTRP